MARVGHLGSHRSICFCTAATKHHLSSDLHTIYSKRSKFVMFQTGNSQVNSDSQNIVKTNINMKQHTTKSVKSLPSLSLTPPSLKNISESPFLYAVHLEITIFHSSSRSFIHFTSPTISSKTRSEFVFRGLQMSNPCPKVAY